MMRRRILLGAAIILISLPVLAVGLWLASGRAMVTKSGLAVTTQLKDELFGGVNEETQFVPGPICGYYVGLDAVGAAALAAVGGGLVLWWVSRRRRRHGWPAERGTQHES